MKYALNRSNLWEPDSLSGKIDGEELGDVKGLAPCLATTELGVARRVRGLSKTAKKVLEGQVKSLDRLLEGLGVGLLEKGVILFQFF